ncbi:S41 family peptidase [Lignipirellula cremea]|uniref:Carboxy-terminal processing protease CtpB n=1 Tax=Lignipirellula cremea TaxID=2528010 RepID=A0A518E0K7_9BACT|nr:S41 family peptidase [Lignipirellula cremea]QDU97591.1 Carboxy-terminal processing protease CtpB precursor [Lignipirellula cremea]
MPFRNLLVIIIAAVFSIACYQKAVSSRYAGELSYAMQLIENNYVEEVDPQQLFDRAISGMVKGLDPNSIYLPPSQFPQFDESLKQRFGGVGVFVGVNEDTHRLTVLTPLPDTPAWRAGILAGDEIMAIDGVPQEQILLAAIAERMEKNTSEPIALSVKKPGIEEPASISLTRRELDKILLRYDADLGVITLQQANDLPDSLQPEDQILAIDDSTIRELTMEGSTSRMRGPLGEPVVLTVHRPATDATLQVTVKRAEIPLESVRGDTRLPDGSWDYHLQQDPRIGLIRVSSFGDNTVDDVLRALASFEAVPQALILDLRSNNGGYLRGAVEMCDMFIDKGKIVQTLGRGGHVDKTYTAGTSLRLPKNVPMVVLVDNYSASAAEIVAACLQDHQRAIVVGERSYGKGTVQQVYPLKNGRSALKLTTDSYWRPSGANIHRREDATDQDQWGVRPNPGFEIVLTAQEQEAVIRDRGDRDLKSLQSANTDIPLVDQPPEPEVPVVDRQLNKAIEYLQGRIAPQKAAA